MHNFTGHAANDFDTLSQEEREVFYDHAIESAFQAWADHMVKHGQTLNLRRRFLDSIKRLAEKVEAAR